MSDSEHPPASSSYPTHSCTSDRGHYTQCKDIMVFIAGRKMQGALSHLLPEESVEVKAGILAQDCLCADPVKLPDTCLLQDRLFRVVFIANSCSMNLGRFLLFYELSKCMLSLENFVPTRNLWSGLCLKAEAQIMWAGYWTAKHLAQRGSFGFLLWPWSLSDCRHSKVLTYSPFLTERSIIV